MTRDTLSIGAVVLLLAAGLGAAIPLLLYPDERDVVRAAEGLPACTPAQTTGSCRSGGLVLTIATADNPLLLPDVQARVLRTRLTDGRVSMRVRVRNAGRRAQAVEADSGQFVLRVAGRDITATGVDAPVRLSTGEGATLSLRFELGAAQAANGRDELLRTAQLRVQPFAPDVAGTPRRLGVIRLAGA